MKRDRINLDPVEQERVAMTRRRAISEARDKCDAALDHEDEAKQLLVYYMKTLAEIYFAQGKFEEARKMATDTDLSLLYEKCSKAYQRLNAAMCDCVVNGENGPRLAKSQFKVVYIGKLNAGVAFVECQVCCNAYAVTVTDDKPINSLELVGKVKTRKEFRQVDFSKEMKSRIVRSLGM